MRIEFELPNRDVSFLGTFDQTGKVRRVAGRYHLTLDSDDPADRRQFLRLFEKDQIKFDGCSAKDLAPFDAGFAEVKTRKLFEDLRRCREELPQLIEESEMRSAEAVVIKAALDENADVSRVDALFSELQKKEAGAELGKVKLQTAQRRIAEIENKIRAVIFERRKREAGKLKAQLAPAAERFNGEVREAYSRFLSVARELLPRIAECESGFAPDIYCASPAVSVGDGQKLKTLRAVPRRSSCVRTGCSFR